MAAQIPSSDVIRKAFDDEGLRIASNMNDILRLWGGLASLNYKPAVGGDMPFSKDDAWKQSQWCFDVITQDGLLRARHPT